MSGFRLILRSLFHYRWINLSVLAGVALTSAILSGALVVGDSVKESLRQNAAARLSQIGPVVVGGERFLTAALADRMRDSLAEGSVAPVLAIEATASNRSGGTRVNQIQGLGVDENFWNLSTGGEAPDGFDDERWIGINEPLAQRIGAKVGDTLIVRVEIPGALSKDAPLSGESEQTTPFTAKVSSIVKSDELGLFSLRAEQVPPSTLFVKQKRLEESVEQSGLINLILGGDKLEAEAFRSSFAAEWDLEDLQLKVEDSQPEGAKQLVSSRIFFDEAIVQALGKITEVESPVLTYLATDIQSGENATPYSMVAAVGPTLNEIVTSEIEDDEIVLSDWIAEDLSASEGDEVTLVYNVVGAGRKLIEQEKTFRVGAIEPLSEKGWDESWTPEFPGIFDVDDLDDWEPGIPIDRERIREKDDVFWDNYRATPKAFVNLNAGREMWANRFGNATSVRFELKEESAPLADQLRPHLDLSDLGIEIRDLPADAEAAVSNSFDFGSLFASMSFFLIVAALVLTVLVFVFVMLLRAPLIVLLFSLCYPLNAGRRLFTTEALILSVAGALLGLIGGYIYTRLAL